MVRYEDSGGAVRIGKAVYVDRDVDAEFVRWLGARRDIFIATAARQSGKSSLWVKTQDALKDKGFTFGTADFREVYGEPEDSTNNAPGWTDTLLRGVTRAFKLDLGELKGWLAANAELPLTNKITAYFETYLRPHFKGPIVAAFDEIDVVQKFGYFTDNLFEAIRVLAQRRDALDISFVLIGVNRPEDLLKTVRPSAFNIQTRDLVLRDFDASDRETVEAWAAPYPHGTESQKTRIAGEVLAATGGQPYLTASLLQEAADEQIIDPEQLRALLDDRIARARNEDWRATHFFAPRDMILERPGLAFEILAAYENALDAPLVARDLKPKIRAGLLTSGLLHADFADKSRLVVRSPIYRAVFDVDWIKRMRAKLGNEVFSEEFSFDWKPATSAEKRKRICIINTGGMISTERQPSGKVEIPADLSRFFRRFPELNAIADIEAVGLMAKDSSNMNPEDWERIAEAIFTRRYEGFGGFVISHGTDTLPFTASAVAYALGSDLTFPVVFVGSQVGPFVLHGDARINLIRAATVATTEILEVVAVVGDEIHRGVRVEKKDDFRFDGFHSPTWRPIGSIYGEVEVRSENVRTRTVAQTKRGQRDMELKNRFSRGVLRIALYPGLDPRFMYALLDVEGLEGIVIETLGVGNVPTEGHWSLIPFIESATKSGVPVLLASQFPIRTGMAKDYKPAEAPVAAGALAALDMSSPAAVTKFMWVLPQVLEKIASGVLPEHRKMDEIETMMTKNYVGEINEPTFE